MAGFRRPEVPREQLQLWAQRLEDGIPLDHPVRLFDELMRSERFDVVFADWAADYQLTEGQPPYHPRDLAGLYYYGMLNRIRSSRQLESACYNRLDVIWLMSGQKPDHSTLAAFVTRHSKRLRGLFREVMAVGVKAELIKLELVAVDGSKVEADAGRGSVRSADKIQTWLASLEEKIAALEAEWAHNESQEKTLLGDEAPWAPSPEKSPAQQMAKWQRRKAKLQDALAQIERRQQESVGRKPVKAIASTTDPASRSMKDKEGRVKPNYNVQLVVDNQASMIVAAQVNDAAEDHGQLIPMIDELIDQCGRAPTAVSADSGYNTGPALAELEKRGIKAYLPDAGTRSDAADAADGEREAVQAARAGEVLTEAQWLALPKDSAGRIDKAAFNYDPASDSYRCPAGERLVFIRTSQDRQRSGVVLRRQYGFAANSPCALCAHATACCRVPQRGRTLNRDQYEEQRERLRARMATEEGKAIYQRRRETVEPRFGHIKHVLSVRRFLRRGLGKVTTEWSMLCTAVNIGVLLREWKKVVAVL